MNNQSKVIIDDEFKLIGGEDEPPKKKDNQIPINENDVADLDYITEG
jgi:hypothetical protein